MSSLTVSIISNLRGTNPSTILDVTEELCLLAIDIAKLDVALFFSYLLLYTFFGAVLKRYLHLIFWLFWLALSSALAIYFAAQAAQHTEIVAVPRSGINGLLFEKGITSSAMTEVARNLLITSLCAIFTYNLGSLRLKDNSVARFSFIVVGFIFFLAAVLVAAFMYILSDVVLEEETRFDEQEFLGYLGVALIPFASTPIIVTRISDTMQLIRKKNDAKQKKKTREKKRPGLSTDLLCMRYTETRPIFYFGVCFPLEILS